MKDHEREPGFYWVQLIESGPLQVAEWSTLDGCWYLSGDEVPATSAQLFWIDDGHRLDEPRDRQP